MSLSEKSRAILEAISKGHSYEQILVQELAWTYHDIFNAAAEALKPPEAMPSSKSYSLEAIRKEFPHAYEKWESYQDEQLAHLYKSGKTVIEIAEEMQRKPGGIQSRLKKLNLV